MINVASFSITEYLLFQEISCVIHHMLTGVPIRHKLWA